MSMEDMSRLEQAYKVALWKNDVKSMVEHLNNFSDCVWLFENGEDEFKIIALKRAGNKVNTFDEFKWLMKKVWKYQIIEKNKKKIKDTIRDLRRH